MKRVCLLIGMACLLALAGCDGSDGRGDPDSDGTPDTPDNAAAMRWWNALTPEQMVAALFGDEATAEQTAAAQKMYADLDNDTKALVNAAADEIYDDDADYASVGDWWETLDCRLMRVAAGDGITADPMSPYCAHYPGSGFAKILSADAKAHVDYVGMALLYRDTPGLFVPFVGRGTRYRHHAGVRHDARGWHYRADILRVHGVRGVPGPRRAGGAGQPARFSISHPVLGPGNRQLDGLFRRRRGSCRGTNSPQWRACISHGGRDAAAVCKHVLRGRVPPGCRNFLG